MAVSSSEMILLIASLIITVTVSSVLASQVLTIGEETESVGSGLSQRIREDIDILNDKNDFAYIDSNSDGTNETLKIYIKNTGSSALPTEKELYSIYIDGRFTTIDSISIVQGSGSQLDIGEVALIEANREGLDGEHRLKVVSGSGQDTVNIIIQN